MPACSPAGEMLCDEILPKDKFDSIKRIMDPVIFASNYMQIPIDAEGRLYQTILTYTDLPKDTERVISYTDTADTGSDFLCTIIGHQYKGEGYITDIIYSNEGMEITEPLTAKTLVDNKVNFATVESNAGGRSFARNVQRIITDKYKTCSVTVKWQHESRNKVARILTASTFIMNHLYFPENWHERWPEFFMAIYQYQRTGKNKHDDAPDALTGFAELIQGGSYSGLIEWMERKKKERESIDK
jgi:predicted phage terminase large subunit-like protein